MSNVNQQPAAGNMIVSTAFSAKFATKGEIWRFLATECSVYLPSYKTVTIWHLKDLASGIKKVSACSFIFSSSPTARLLRGCAGHSRPSV